MENGGIALTGLAVIVAAILIVIVIGSVPSLSPSPAFSYDDYIEVEDAISAEGSLEIVEIAGRTYVHAADVGEGVYKLADGKVITLTVDKAVLDIVVAMGQSNNRYTCWDIPEIAAFPELGKAYYWGTEFEPVTNPNVQGATMQELRDPDTGAVKLGDKIPVFCARWVEQTGHKIFYVITAVGGSSITSWIPGEQQYQRQIRILNQATAAIDSDRFDYDISCCTWIQGEADSTMPLEDYLDYFGQMWDGLTSESYPYDLKRMIMATPRVGTAVEADRILAEQTDGIVLATDAATTFTMDNGLLGPDGTHWTQEGDNLVAEAMSSAALDTGDKDPTIYILVALLTVVAVSGAIIGWRHRDG